jgi:uncharacterized protein (TIGR03435 family)
MQELDDNSLLKQYAEQNSEEAFGVLVSRHINKVYSVALRQTRNPAHAEEITQAVFVILAKKVNSLGRRVVLSGWLYQTARLASLTFLKSEIRRARREQEAHMQSILNEPADETWMQIAPLLDLAMASLNETDRYAVVLRFFDGKSMREVGDALGATEDTAKKRVRRALEKLRNFFGRRGVHSTTAIIADAISSNSVQAAPPTLAQSVTAVAIAKGATAGGSTLTLVKGALKVMAWTKAKSTIVVGVVVLLATGSATLGVKEYQDHRSEAWELAPFPDPSVDFDGSGRDKRLRQAPSELQIVPSRYRQQKFDFATGGGYTYITANGVVANSHEPWRAMGVGLPLASIVRVAYATESAFPESWRTIYRMEIPMRPLYDFISTLPDSSQRPLQQLIRKKFGITAKWELIETNVLAVRILDAGVRAFHPAGSLLRSRRVVISNARERMNYNSGWLHESTADTNGIVSETFFNSSIDQMIRDLSFEGVFQTPIVNETGLTNRYDYTLVFPRYDPNWKADGWNWKTAWKTALSQQLGLELAPTQADVEMLVVEKAN